MLSDLDGLMEQEGIDAIIAYGNAFEVPDIYWLTGFRSPDSITVFKNHGEDVVVATGFNTVERVKKESLVKETLDLTEVYRGLMREGKRSFDHPELEFGTILRELFTGETLGVPDHLPARILIAIQEMGVNIKVVPKLFLKARATKSPREVKMIHKAASATINAVSHIAEMIKDSDIGEKKVLMLDNKPLTVFRIKNALEHYLLDMGAESAEDSIVAVGKKGFDWHYLGAAKDKLKAESPIIIDVFPRLKNERYVADVTRTVVKGHVPDRVREMFDAVHAAVLSVSDALRAGQLIDADVNMACYNTLKERGFDSSRLNPSTVEGMTHGLGHGIGLNVHEHPSLYDRTARFEVGNVVAIEPGVYLKGFGGVRIENDFVVRKGRAKRLTTGLDDVLFV